VLLLITESVLASPRLPGGTYLPAVGFPDAEVVADAVVDGAGRVPGPPFDKWDISVTKIDTPLNQSRGSTLQWLLVAVICESTDVARQYRCECK